MEINVPTIGACGSVSGQLVHLKKFANSSPFDVRHRGQYANGSVKEAVSKWTCVDDEDENVIWGLK